MPPDAIFPDRVQLIEKMQLVQPTEKLAEKTETKTKQEKEPVAETPATEDSKKPEKPRGEKQ
jgi:hypothetical protein